MAGKDRVLPAEASVRMSPHRRQPLRIPSTRDKDKAEVLPMSPVLPILDYSSQVVAVNSILAKRTLRHSAFSYEYSIQLGTYPLRCTYISVGTNLFACLKCSGLVKVIVKFKTT